MYGGKNAYYDENGPLDMTVVVGHTPTIYINRNPAFVPVVTREAIFLATGSFIPKGHITCMDIRSGKIWQSR